MSKFSLVVLDYNRDLKVDGCPSKEDLFGQSTLLMNVTYIVFPSSYLKIHGIIIASGIK